MSSDSQENTGRDPKGRFIPGCAGGPGGSRRRKEFRRAIEDAVTPDHLAGLMRKTMMMALGGNTKAIDIAFSQLVGRPSEAPEPAEVLDITFQDLNTADACREAMATVLQKITQGKVNRATGELLLTGLRECLGAIEAAQKDQQLDPGGESEPPVPNNVLRGYFRRFRRSGELPDTEHEAAAVIAKVKAGFVLVPCDALLPGTTTDEFVAKPRAEAPAMDALLDEAVYGHGLVKAIARHLLRGVAQIGLDVTAPQFQDFLPPEFGSMAMEFVGFNERLVRRPYTKQARRLLKRIEAMRKRAPKTPAAERAWHRKLQQATTAFQMSGELPENEDLMDAILLLGEFTTLTWHMEGRDVGPAMRLFDAAAQGSGDARKDAIAQLAAMAKSGLLDGSEKVACLGT